MSALKFYPLFIGGLILALCGPAVLLFSTMFYGPSYMFVVGAVLAMALYTAGFRMLRAAERY